MLNPEKRVLGDSKNRRNVLISNASKKRKLDNDETAVAIKPSSQDEFRKPRQPQQKSQFVEEVLEKLTQDISGLKENNSEKDQQWSRPSLDDFNATEESLCFQQIETEEGTLAGGKTAVKLFGVTQVCHPPFRLSCLFGIST